MMERFATCHPDVEVTIHFGEFVDPSGGLRTGEADVAFVYGDFNHEGLQLTLLFSEQRGIAATVASVVDALGASAGVMFGPVPGLKPLDFFVARRTGDDRRQVVDVIASSLEALEDREQAEIA